MKNTISSTSTAFTISSKKKLESHTDTSEFLLQEKSPDKSKLAASGIHTLFTAFPYAVHTLQFIKIEADGKSKNIAKAYSDPKAALKDAVKFSNEAYDIFFMVNEGDGIIHPGKRICRSQQNVINLSKCFIDSDNCPVEKIRAYLQAINLTPHLVIESSPGRFHFYFSFDPVAKDDRSITNWKAIQHILHRLGDPTIKSPSKTLGTDSTMHDYSKILRVPGFTHVRKAFVSKVIEQNDIPNSTLEELFTLTNAQSFLDICNSQTANLELPDPDSNTTYDAGERYAALQKLSMHLANQTHIPREEHFNTFQHFVKTKLNNEDGTYLHTDSSLTPKSHALFNSAFDKIKSEIVTNTTYIQTSDPDKKPSDPWHLPDSFYLTAPNGFGDVVKQVMDNSLYPCAALAFGTFLTGLSILRAKTTFTPGGSAPTIYTINVAISGYGKSDPMTMLQNTFVHHGIGSLTENEIRSDRGMYEHLAINDGLGFFLIDEVATVLRAIQNPNAATHHANIASALLRLYSAGAMKGVSFGKVAKSRNKEEKAIVIDNPMIALCGFTTIDNFNTLFNIDAISRGLVQRFIPIVPEIVEIPENPNVNKQAIIKSPLFDGFIVAHELDDDGNPVPSLTNTERTKSSFHPDARQRFTDICRYYRNKMLTAAKDPELSATSGLYSRVAEQIERIATVLSQDVIESVALDYAITFMESRHRALMATMESTILRGVGSESMAKEEKILMALSRMCQEQSLSIIAKRDIFQSVRRHFKSTDEMNRCLNDLKEQGKVELVSFKKNTRSIVGVRFAEIL